MGLRSKQLPLLGINLDIIYACISIRILKRLGKLNIWWLSFLNAIQLPSLSNLVACPPLYAPNKIKISR